MCGINGFNFTENDNRTIKSMNRAISHRGPDEEAYLDSNITLGQVRLSILDLSNAGHQPMYYCKERGASNKKFNRSNIGISSLSIVFNGEIYNYLEIKEELQAFGFQFTTGTDTEVILASYVQWGKDCVSRFNGMWAFCIHDKENDEMFLSRDRLGVKPLYYYNKGKKFIFSSELKGILEHKDLNINSKSNLNPDALDFYFTIGFIPSPYSIYKDVFKMEARQNIIFDIKKKAIKKKYYYYDIPVFSPINDKKSLIDEGRQLLKSAVSIRMRSDVPVGAFLSGGLDSTSVVGEMRDLTDISKLHTFSIGFDGKFDESEYALEAKDYYGSKHHHKYFREKDFRALEPEINFFYDEPFADYSNFPTTFVSDLAIKNVKVALSGDGGDEIFGGYMMHKLSYLASIIYSLPRPIKKLLHKMVPSTSNSISHLSVLKELFRVCSEEKSEFYSHLLSKDKYIPEVYKKWTTEKLKHILEKCGGNFVQAIIDFDLFYNTLGDNFCVKVDRASMSRALEIRSPFLDYRFIEYSRKIPVRWKTNSRKGKLLMRDIIKPLIPKRILNRGKKGFEPPLTEWILHDDYEKKLKQGLESLKESKIISDSWYKFYKDTVFVSHNKMYQIYKIKLYLLLDWQNKWIKS